MFSKDLAAVVSNPHDKQEIVSILPYFELSYPDGQAVELKYGYDFLTDGPYPPGDKEQD